MLRPAPPAVAVKYQLSRAAMKRRRLPQGGRTGPKHKVSPRGLALLRYFLVDHFGQGSRGRRAIRIWRRRGSGLAQRSLDFVERFALRGHGLDLVVLVFYKRELFLHVGLGHHLAMAG